MTLKDSEQRFRILIEQSIASVYIIQDGQLTYLNPRFSEILGFSEAEELLGKNPLTLVADKDCKRIEQLFFKLSNREILSERYICSMLHKNGSLVDVGMNGSLVTYEGESAIIGLMQDISDKKIAEEQIQCYVNQLKIAFMQTVGLVTTLSEMRDPYTAGHERRVAEIAVAIGKALDLNELQLEGLKVGDYLHDVGKTSVPVEILTKPGKINNLEYELIKIHSRAGYEVLKDVDFPWPVAQIALQHHECIDGSGYPQGLKGEEILFEARIMAVADVVEAMASHRPYRAGLGLDAALAEVERGKGSLYDVAIADTCLKLFRGQGFNLPV